MMILSLLVLFNYLFGLLKSNRNVKKVDHSDNSESLLSNNEHYFSGEAEFVGGSIQFFPPVYLQRYNAVCRIIEENKKNTNINKVVDFGCSNLSFFNFIKRLNGVEEYIGVDIDKATVESYYTRVFPLTSDYLNKRSSPLKAVVLLGSVTEPDVRLKNTNVVVAIELIEHMYPDELNELPFNIFGYIQPEVAIFTTPNADFNVLFRELGFRHPDHKFEWSRLQFEDWGKNLVVQYPDYDVRFHGVGWGPKGTEELGCCSQIAVFVRKTAKNTASFEDLVLYKCVYEVEYPFQTAEEKQADLLDYEVYHAINDLTKTEEYTVNDRIEIPVHLLLEKLSWSCSFETVIAYLEKLNKNVEYINNKATLILPNCDTEDSYSLSINDDNIYAASSENLEEEFWNETLDDAGNMESNQHKVEDLNSVEGVESSTVNVDVPDGQNPANCSHNMDLCQSTNSKLLGNGLDDSGAARPSEEDKVLVNILDENVIDKPYKYTGAIPKRREMTPEKQFTFLPSTSVDKLSSCLKNSGRSPDLLDVSLPASFFSPILTNQLSSECNDSGVLKFVSNFDDSCMSDTHIPPKEKNSGIGLHDDDSFCFKSKDITSTPYPSTTGKPHSCIKCQLFSENSQMGKDVCITHMPQNNVAPLSNNSCRNCCHEISEQGTSSFVHRCHSLENINVNNCKNKSFRYSLNIDNELDCDTSVVDMELEVCCKGSSIPSLTDTLGSHSKAPDSGYPNSSHDMDMDLTPEQVDEIITETESSLEDEDSSAEERIEQVQGNLPVVFLDNVENGDVANNNRDGEGNNMEGGEVAEEVLDFEGLVLGAGEVEAGQHESDDEGLYLSALDMSNETLVPEDSSSHDETVFNSVLDLPSSSSSFFRPFEECMVIPPPEEQVEFPPWLLDLSINLAMDLDIGSGDGDRNVVEENSSEIVVAEQGEEREIIVPGDTMGGGDPIINN